MVIIHPSSRRTGERWDSGDGFCPSDIEKGRGVVMVTLHIPSIPLPRGRKGRKEGRKEGRKPWSLPFILLRKKGDVDMAIFIALPEGG